MVDIDPKSYKIGDWIFKTNGEPFKDRRTANAARYMYSHNGIQTIAEKIPEGEGADGWILRVLRVVKADRVPIGVRNKLTVSDKNPEFEYRIVNDERGRIQMFEDAGWEVDPDAHDIGDVRVGQTALPGSATAIPVGEDRTAVLMRKKREWFEEDYRKKIDGIKATEDRLVSKAQMDNLDSRDRQLPHGMRIERSGGKR
jgi:hypothetical protein